MNGSTEDETKKNYDKIISKLAKEVVIQKDSNYKLLNGSLK